MAKEISRIKVSQSTINDIKKMGMTEALKMVKMFSQQGKGTGKAGQTVRNEGKQFLIGETAEGIRRMYGDRRFAEATKTKKKAAAPAKSADAARAKATKKAVAKPAPKAKTADAARTAATKSKSKY